MLYRGQPLALAGHDFWLARRVDPRGTALAHSWSVLQEVALHPPSAQSAKTSTATMTYGRCCFYIILIYQPEKIRNEKVGCSIHLSGTNTDKGLLLLILQQTLSLWGYFSLLQTFYRLWYRLVYRAATHSSGYFVTVTLNQQAVRSWPT